MSDLQRIEAALRKAARRRRWLTVWRGLWVGLLVGAGIWTLSVVAFKLFPVPQWVMVVGGGAGVAAILGALCVAGWRGSTLLETARWVDREEGLRERLSSALELSSSPANEDWRRLLVADAAKHVDQVDPRRLLPVRLPAVSRWAFLVLLLGIGLGFVPEYRTAAYVSEQEEKENIRDTGRELAELTRQNLRRKPPALPPTEKALQDVAGLGDQFAKLSLTRAEALDKLSSVAERLNDELKPWQQNPALQALARAARQPGAGPSGTPQELQRQIDAMQKALGEAAGQGEALDKLQSDMRKLGQAAKDMAATGGSGEAGSKAQMAQALADMAQRARDLGADLPGLENAIAALQANQTDLFLQELGAAMDDLEKVQQMAQAMEQLQQQQAHIGKDLAEQLKNGQGQAAQASLQRMMEKLRSPALTSEELKKIEEEVARSIAPGREFGQVGQHLQKALQQMQQGAMDPAAQSLADASAELQRLMEQLQDSAALREALESLARAEQAIAMGRNWSQCVGQPCAACNGMGCWQCLGGRRWGQGGRAGAGVGTWADDSNWMYPRSDQMVDNSGIQRPDMDPRGVTDRGEGALNPNLMPDKVRGQMSPGSSMPSITLKGVSVRGSSRVEFEEAAAAAQSDAQSALNQDQVPRPYRGAVRDYFDDLKQ